MPATTLFLSKVTFRGSGNDRTFEGRGAQFNPVPGGFRTCKHRVLEDKAEIHGRLTLELGLTMAATTFPTGSDAVRKVPGQGQLLSIFFFF